MRPLRALALIPLAALTACAPATYEVALNNTVPRPIQAQILTVSPDGLLGEVGPMLTLGPGDKGQMHPVQIDANRQMIVSVRCPGARGEPVRHPLRAGLNTVEVAQEAGDFNAPIFLRPWMR